MDQVVERFLRYVKIDTQSDDSSSDCPSTKIQMNLANLLKEEMAKTGFTEITLDENGYLMGTIPSNSRKKIPVTGFLAHMDTSPDMTAKNINPQVHEKYDGGDIVLNKAKGIILSPEEFPELLRYKGQTLITTDGTTLLGADDKAGIAEIMTAMDWLIKHPETEHGKIRVAFTPDEEIGRGADKFNVKEFGAEFAYTIDGGGIGELEFENFNAALATVKVQGRNVHPGTAKNQMLNSIHLAYEFINMLPVSQRPEFTEKYEGFFHIIDFKGTVDETSFRLLIRDHDEIKYDDKKKELISIASFLNKKYGKKLFVLSVKEQYRNMRGMVEPRIEIIEYARKAMAENGVVPDIKPIRGGTDGARLSFMGLPCPNIFAGGHNFHGRYEFIPVESMKKAVEVIIGIAKNVSQV